MVYKKKYKNSNSELKAGVFNKLFFWFLKDTFFKINSKIDQKDLHDVLPENSSKFLGDQMERCWIIELKKSQQRKEKPSLLNATFKAFGSIFWFYGLHVFIICVLLRGLQPYVLGLLIRHFDPRANSSNEQAYTYAIALVAMIIFQAMIGHHSVVGRKQVGLRISVAYSALIYRKILRLSASSANDYTVGKIVNLLSNDLAKFEDFCMFFHYLWVLPIQGLLMAYFIWKNVGIASLAGIFFLTLQTVYIQGYLGKLTGKIRSKVAKKTDERVSLMSEIVDGIRVIKMYAWEKPFENFVFKARRDEMNAIAGKFYLRVASAATSSFAESTSMFLVILVHVLLGNYLEASVVYSVAQYFGMIKTMMTVFYPRAMASMAEARVSVERIQELLLLDETETKSRLPKVDVAEIVIKHLDVSWNNSSKELILEDVNLKFQDGSTYIIAGSVGSGKSSLLKSIIQELKPVDGSIQTFGKLSYASQDPWMFPGTVRSNILFGLSFDEERYERVVSVCGLIEDFEKLPDGDASFVGERGCKLSGGQCARINLARAIYRQADVYLIDDALAAVDVHVGKHIFDNCINEFLKGKIRLLVTNDVRYFEKADEIVLLKNGKVEFCGPYSRFIDQKYTLPQRILQDSDTIVKAVVQEESELKLVKTSGKKLEDDETNEFVKNDNVYWSYFRAGGTVLTLSILTVSLIVAQGFISASDYWLAHWIKRDENHDNIASSELDNSLYVFSALLLMSVITWSASRLLFYKICSKSSQNLHNHMFSRLLKAPMRFFELNSSGKILNRFSKDTGLVDETLPTVTLDAVHVLLMIAGVAVQVLIVNWYAIFPMVVTATVCWKFKNIYLPTAQKIRRLETQAKSPVFSHVNSTISGLPTIRSSEAQNTVISEFDRLQDVHTSSHYLNIVSSSAFGFWLDIISITLLGFVTFGFILAKDNVTTAGIVGLALTQILMLYGSVQYGLRQTTEMMTQMISVERIFEFIYLEQEGPFEIGNNDLKDWPSKGKIEFRDVSLRYSDCEEPVLKNISLSIEPRNKIGIVGRTGAGKTSLVSLLFRLTDFDGSLTIDDVDLRKIGLFDLRRKISIIPQKPVLFTASVRDNLDPLGKYEDEDLWEALESSELGNLFDSLEFKIENRGNNISAGEKQLICFARAILADNKILILDEATANVDCYTNEIIQNIIKKRFKNCTVLTVAHRLSTVSDSDKIVAMKAGEVVEYSDPDTLLKQKDGYFYDLINF